MKKTYLIAVFLLISLAIIVQAADDPKYKISPSIDKESSTGVYIPKDLEDSFKELIAMLHPSLVEEMKSNSEEDMIKYHHGLGIWIRNNWGLWSKSRLTEYFNGIGIFHPDDMSGIIIDSFWRYLNNKPIRLEEQVKSYKEVWETTNREKKK